MVLWRDHSTLFKVCGGDREMRPKNVALDFIQKITVDAGTPLGVVIPLGVAEDCVTASQIAP